MKLKHVRLCLAGFRGESLGNKWGGDGHTRGWTRPFPFFFVPKIFLLSRNNMATDRKIFRVALSNERKRIEIKTRSIKLSGFRGESLESIGNKQGGDGYPRE